MGHQFAILRWTMIADRESDDEVSPRKARLGAPAYWIFLPALVCSAGAVIGLNISAPWFIGAVFGVFIVAIAGLICRALVLRVPASSLCAAIVVGLYWIPPLFALLFVGAGHAPIGLYFFYAIPTFVVVFVNAFAATFSMANKLSPAWALSAFGVGVLCTGIFALSM